MHPEGPAFITANGATGGRLRVLLVEDTESGVLRLNRVTRFTDAEYMRHIVWNERRIICIDV